MSSSIQIYNCKSIDTLCFKAWWRELSDIVDTKKYQLQELGPNGTFDERNTSLIVIPGGHAFGLKDELSTIVERIDNAVRAKSSFLGSCAGAISFTESHLFKCYTKRQGVEKLFDVDIGAKKAGFANHVKTVAPYHTPGGYNDYASTQFTSVEVDWLTALGNMTNKVCRIFHAKGPCFLYSDEPDVRNLATYRTRGNVWSEKVPPMAAIIQYKEHYNPCLFTGIHPEIGVRDMPALVESAIHSVVKEDESSIKTTIDALKRELLDSEKVRNEMLQSWLLELKISLRTSDRK